jgi:hypothetical protein
MVDRYTKTVLTVIAAALVAIVIQEVAPNAIAQSGMDCGRTVHAPCCVTISNAPFDTLNVTVK